ncbi:hypothetical protein GUITHDRAFT_144713 [Guillardia theta CCMP2712]|uniref:Uncharacterized protein n=1 Tax=Guillardia theta (strain CCMP2712) TaxID=905079 RepID=L1INU4_GUITC|nr:hypothetical protein GUITHDRAFT_144713 [Guillardia theta CCMP2712]EKX37737.1 hypothetical protein GUITHDRAFT_144713 [Guillardia theta CCMP2712]|eukprot:XP_005824717.1 hypothetical protein GUITHDRAFT_144713 [Guillardia theta CCMP2712]
MAIGDVMEGLDGSKVEMFSFENQTRERVLVSLFEGESCVLKESSFIESGGMSPVMDSRPGDEIYVTDPTGKMLFMHEGKAATKGQQEELTRTCCRVLTALTEAETMLRLTPILVEHANHCLEECEEMEELLGAMCSRTSSGGECGKVDEREEGGCGKVDEREEGEGGEACCKDTERAIEQELEVIGNDLVEVGKIFSSIAYLYNVNGEEQFSVEDIVRYTRGHNSEFHLSTD